MGAYSFARGPSSWNSETADRCPLWQGIGKKTGQREATSVPEKRVHTPKGRMPWVGIHGVGGLVPESLELGWGLLLCVVVRVIAINLPVNPAAVGFRLQSMQSSGDG